LLKFPIQPPAFLLYRLKPGFNGLGKGKKLGKAGEARQVRLRLLMVFLRRRFRFLRSRLIGFGELDGAINRGGIGGFVQEARALSGGHPKHEGRIMLPLDIENWMHGKDLPDFFRHLIPNR
jgi:hypothetical protein